MNQDIYNKLSLEEIEKFKEYYNKNSNLEIYDNLTINELFNESVLRNPDNIALVKGNEKIIMFTGSFCICAVNFWMK